MSGATYFNQECPICGRHLRVRVTYLGRQVICQHCNGRFEAYDPENPQHATKSGSSGALLERAEELIASASGIRHIKRA
ncbi:MAG: hypothetical protein KDA41_00230 [Planctomycetales bacterium]|nr:hypothetical protein [Planctomycetales bacterium]